MQEIVDYRNCKVSFFLGLMPLMLFMLFMSLMIFILIVSINDGIHIYCGIQKG